MMQTKQLTKSKNFMIKKHSVIRNKKELSQSEKFFIYEKPIASTIRWKKIEFFPQAVNKMRMSAFIISVQNCTRESIPDNYAKKNFKGIWKQ